MLSMATTCKIIFLLENDQQWTATNYPSIEWLGIENSKQHFLIFQARIQNLIKNGYECTEINFYVNNQYSDSISAENFINHQYADYPQISGQINTPDHDL